MNEVCITFQSGGYENTDKAALVLRQFCSENNILSAETDKLEICLVEALNNVYEHSYENSGEGNVEIKLSLLERAIRIEISDNGKARSSLKPAVLEFDPEDIENLPEGGMGLYLIESIMDETRYTSINNRNTLNMIKNI